MLYSFRSGSVWNAISKESMLSKWEMISENWEILILIDMLDEDKVKQGPWKLLVRFQFDCSLSHLEGNLTESIVWDWKYINMSLIIKLEVRRSSERHSEVANFCMSNHLRSQRFWLKLIALFIFYLVDTFRILSMLLAEINQDQLDVNVEGFL